MCVNCTNFTANCPASKEFENMRKIESYQHEDKMITVVKCEKFEIKKSQ